MLTLRKILLCNYLFYGLFIIVLLLTIIRLSIPHKTLYTITDTKVIGIIISIKEKEDYTEYIVKGKEKVICKSSEKNKYNLGDKVLLIGTLSTPKKNKTKDLFNYEEFLKHNNIFFTMQIESIKRIKKNKNIIYFLKQKTKDYLKDNNYLNTFLLGDKSYIKKDVYRSYQENGISHLFAISGMHISLLSTIIDKLLKKHLREEQRFKVIILFLIMYLLLVGFSPSILRGVLFYILFTCNNVYYFYIKKENLFLVILSIALLINPNYIYDIGFKYSYLISFSLLKCSNLLNSNNKVLSLLKVSGLSFLVSSPITLKNFYQLNLLSIIYNIFFVPYVSIILFPLTLIVFIFRPLEPIYNVFTSILENTSMFLSKITIGKLVFKKIPIIFYIIYLIIVFIYLYTKNKKVIIIYSVLLLIHLLLPIFDNSVYLEAIDVGQGDSILIHNKNHNILIDTGGKRSDTDHNIFYNTINPLLKMKGIKKIDYLILSHGDYDHIGEAENVINNIKVERVIFNIGDYNYLEKDLIKLLEKKKIKYYKNIEELNWNKTNIYFLNTNDYSNENDNSNVIYLELNNYKILLMGDAGVVKEKDIMNEFNLDEIDIFKAGHHGSNTSSSKEFINYINPKYTIISVGEKNKYGHPNREVLDNLNNSFICRTDKLGSLKFDLNKKYDRIITGCE
ncbi:MAG: DNA internalization-related competence protein ComEC/Rec2 [Bacilli bacterium]|nr:DNA internalization-related competence protein ComEC/Rec2 [Bacilli bacterium]MBR6137715.1 DNA internalization-related competence protein ComEC/Rec2 [Bacilli bacterium]